MRACRRPNAESRQVGLSAQPNRARKCRNLAKTTNSTPAATRAS